MSGPAPTEALPSADDLFYGSPEQLLRLLDSGFLGSHSYRRAPNGGGGWFMACPVEPGGGHIVHATADADGCAFECSAGCDEEWIRFRLAVADDAAFGDLPQAAPPTSWAPRDLGPVLDGKQIDQSPALLARGDGVRLLYRGKLHDLSGEPESCKGWLALHAAAECLKAGGRVAYFDFEDSEATAVERLLALGVERDTIRTVFAYVRPDEPLGAPQARSDLEATLSLAPELVVVDGVTEALALHGLDLEKNSDVAKWLELLPRPLARTGAAVALLDHVTKDREARGRYAIGAQHKLAGVDVAYRLAVVEPFGRGKEGLVRLTVAKDRPGHVRQHATAGRIADVRLRSHGDGSVTVALEPPDSAPAFRPTVLMERLSRAVEQQPGATKSQLRSAVTGRSDAKDVALQLLVADAFVRVEREGQAHCHYSVRPYRDEGDE